MNLDDERQRLVNYAAAINACYTAGADFDRSAARVAWEALTEDERETLTERWSDLMAPSRAS